METANKVVETPVTPQSIDDLFDDISVDTDVSLPGLETPKNHEEDTYDLQKELEAKFDELFGPIDD